MKAPHKWDVRYQVEVGTDERHLLDVSWDQVWGLMSIRVDGAEVVHRRHLFGLRRVRRFELSVGRARSAQGGGREAQDVARRRCAPPGRRGLHRR